MNLCVCDPWNFETRVRLPGFKFKWKQTPLALGLIPQSLGSAEGVCPCKCVSSQLCLLQQLEWCKTEEAKNATWGWENSEFEGAITSAAAWWGTGGGVDEQEVVLLSSPCASARGTHFANSGRGPTQNHQPSASASKQHWAEELSEWKTLNFKKLALIKKRDITGCQ